MMEGRQCRRRRPRRFLCSALSDDTTALLHTRLRDAKPLELQAHVSRVASCVVISSPAVRLRQRRDDGSVDQPHVCVVSGDAVGNLSIFYLSVSDLCAKTQSDDPEEVAQRLRIRPDVRFRGAHRGGINCMYHLENTSTVLTGGDDGALRLWNVQEDTCTGSKLQCVREFLFHSSCVLTCDVDPSQTYFVTAALDSVVALWLPGVPIPLLTIAIGEPCFAVSIIPQDPTLLLVTHHERVTVWDIRKQPHYLHFQRALLARIRDRLAKSVASHLKAPLELLQQSFAGEDKLSWLIGSQAWLASIGVKRCSNSPNVPAVYDEVTRRFVQPFVAHTPTAQLLSARPAHFGRTMLTFATDHTHKLWDLHTHQGVASFELRSQHNGSSAASSCDGSHSLVAAGTLSNQERFLYGADASGNVHVWDFGRSITSLEHQADPVVYPTHSLPGHSFFVTSIALSHDNTILVTGDASGKLHVRIAM